MFCCYGCKPRLILKPSKAKTSEIDIVKVLFIEDNNGKREKAEEKAGEGVEMSKSRINKYLRQAHCYCGDNG